MFNKKSRSGYGSRIQKIKAIRAAAVVFAGVLLLIVSIPFAAKLKNRTGGERKELLRFWDEGSFEKVFSLSKTALDVKPMDYFLLTLHGFSAYQMGISQINTFDTLTFIDQSIRALRKAMLLKNAANDGRVYYVLGKAYSYKGAEYADLSVTYLEKARELSYQAADIPEYLGLAYAAIGDYRGSVAAFSLALENPPDAGAAQNPSDLLLLSIARSYIALEAESGASGTVFPALESARAYLLRCIEISPDFQTIAAARLLLAGVFLKLGDHTGAEDQYTAVLRETGESAEAHYQLGELYALRGDTIRARSEWRLAYRSDPAHAGARSRLNI
jgi:tetratricopeptide (TPR) repeat protein